MFYITFVIVTVVVLAFTVYWIYHGTSKQLRVVNKLLKLWAKKGPDATPELDQEMNRILDSSRKGTLVALTIDKEGLPVYISAMTLQGNQISVSIGDDTWVESCNPVLWNSTHKMLWNAVVNMAKKHGNITLSAVSRLAA